jgi:zinc protease
LEEREDLMAFNFSHKRMVGAAGGAVLLGFFASGDGLSADAGGDPLPEIPFVRERLENGLTVIYHQDRTLPLVTLNTWFYVGSKDEPPGRSGFAHLFEHLLFMGTERVPSGEYDRIIEGAGGANNASTTEGRTNYFESGPAELLPMLIYLEADRMEGFGRAIDAEKLETQRRVVRNERRQSYENRPYGKASLEKWKVLYPPGHPYHEPVIGSHEDLERATVEDVQEFFRKFYVPSNASLVVAGDFEIETARELVRKYYGKIPAGTPPPHPKPRPVELKEEKRLALADRVQLPRLSLIYHSPQIYAEGDADLDIASSILGGGKSSRLYRSLVYERKLAQDVGTIQSSQTLASLFEIQATARPGVDLADLEKAIDEEIAKLAAEPPTATEVERARNGYEISFWRRIEPLGAKADLLNTYQFYFSDPAGIARDLGRYWKVTPESVRTWVGKVLRKDARLVLTVVPEGKAPQGAPVPTVKPQAPGAAASTVPPPSPGPEGKEAAPVGAGSPATSPEPKGEGSSPGGAKTKEDRPAPAADLLPPRPPPPGSPAPFDPPMPQVGKLSGGIPFWSLESHEVPVVSLTFIVNGAGAASDPPGKYGLASIAASMLDEGAGSRDALEIADDLEILGASLSASASRERGELRLVVLRRNLDRALDILADVLLRPRFEEKEWERVKTLAVNELVQRRDSPPAVARIVADRQFFGDGHPYAAPIGGYADMVKGIGLDEARSFYRERWVPRDAAVVAAGDIGPDLRAKLDERLGSWKTPEGAPRPPAPPAGKPPRPRLVLVEKAGAPQTVISIDMPGLARTDPSYTDLLLANLVFGGTFTSRLNLNLREEHEFTYGARTEFHRLRGPGAYIIQTSVKTDVTGRALEEIVKECRGMDGGLRAGEIEKVMATARTGAVESFSTTSSSLEVLAQVAALGLPPDDPKRMLRRIEAAAPADVEKAARSIIRWDAGTVVLVGDRKAIEEGLAAAKGLDLPAPIVVGPDGI